MALVKALARKTTDFCLLQMDLLLDASWSFGYTEPKLGVLKPCTLLRQRL
jgi:hypothetical protein